LIGMAPGETVAHLNCLAARGRDVRANGGDGMAWWRAG
jgi:hypothetical protein